MAFQQKYLWDLASDDLRELVYNPSLSDVEHDFKKDRPGHPQVLSQI